MENSSWPSGQTGAETPFREWPRNGTDAGNALWDRTQNDTNSENNIQDRTQPDAGAEAPLRDWQQETWYGPFPSHENPFDEPEDAPELRELRSEELNNRSGEFWESQTNGYRFGKSPQTSAQRTKAEPPKPVSRKRKMALTAIVLALALGAWAVLYYGVFTVRDVVVQGNDQIPAGEIIRLSGIRTGSPILALNEDAVAGSIGSNPRLKLKYLEKKLPGTVLLRVQEREECCWMTWNGIIYTMDKQGTVLSETEDLEHPPERLIRVDGLNIRAGALPGQTLVLDDLEQQTVLHTLFLEMRVLGCTELIQDADLSNLGSLLLTTRDGFTVAMGTSQNIHAKMRSMLLTREELLRRQYRGGIINVSLPETPIFSPAE